MREGVPAHHSIQRSVGRLSLLFLHDLVHIQRVSSAPQASATSPMHCTLHTCAMKEPSFENCTGARAKPKWGIRCHEVAVSYVASPSTPQYHMPGSGLHLPQQQ